MFYTIKEKIKFIPFKIKFRKLNQHNQVVPENIFPIDKVKIGKESYGSIRVETWGSQNEKLEIGDYVSIGKNVKFMLGGNHYYKHFSTYPFGSKTLKIKGYNDAYSKGKIKIDDDVWIGDDSLILSGVKISQGAIIGARSVVTKDIPPYAIAVGNPAKVVKYRFSKEIINELLKIDLKKVNYEFIKNNEDLLYKQLDLDTLDELKNNII